VRQSDTQDVTTVGDLTGWGAAGRAP